MKQKENELEQKMRCKLPVASARHRSGVGLLRNENIVEKVENLPSRKQLNEK